MSTTPDNLSSAKISDLLRKETQLAHKNVENTEAAVWLTRGCLPREEYIRYLIILWQVYSVLENALDTHSSHPVLAPTYNPALLARSSALSSDIAQLLHTSESTWQLHPLARSISQNIPPALLAYTAHIHNAATSLDPSILLAHSYVRYIGDLSGGQQIGRSIAKAYGLDDTTGLGTQFYRFKKLGSSMSPAISGGDISAIKDWFRKGMNEGVGENWERKKAIISEANAVFRFNEGILGLLRPSPPQYKATTPHKNMSLLLSSETAKRGSIITVVRVLSSMLAIGIAYFVLITMA